jgi:CBS domain-containing protein
LIQEEEKKGGKKGRLLGIITLSDVLKYVIGEVGIGEGIEPDEETSPTTPIRPPPTPSPAPSLTRQDEPHDAFTPKPAERSLSTPPGAADTS